jgi:hypothetical protein
VSYNSRENIDRDLEPRRRNIGQDFFVSLFDFLTFFLGIALVILGEYIILGGSGATPNTNMGLAFFCVLVTVVGVGISLLRQLTTENEKVEDSIRWIYGSICFVLGLAFIIIPVIRSLLLLTSPAGIDLGTAVLLSFTVFVGIVFLFIGYSWVGAFNPPSGD